MPGTLWLGGDALYRSSNLTPPRVGSGVGARGVAEKATADEVDFP